MVDIKIFLRCQISIHISASEPKQQSINADNSICQLSSTRQRIADVYNSAKNINRLLLFLARLTHFLN